MRARRRLWVVAVLLCAATVSACTSADDDTARPGQPPSDSQVEVAGPAQPFSLRVENIRLVGMDNAGLLGRAGTPVDNDAAETAVRGARDRLRAFLNAQLVDENSRFSAEPIDRLLTGAARALISADDRAALGELDLSVERTITGPAAASATALMHGGAPHAVTLAYTALLTVVADDESSSSMKQTGTITFVPTDDGWRAEAVDVSLEMS